MNSYLRNDDNFYAPKMKEYNSINEEKTYKTEGLFNKIEKYIFST